MLYLAGIQSVLCQLLVTCLWLPTADEGFNIIQQPAQSTTIVLPAGPLLQAGTAITFLAFHVSAQTPDSKERFFHKNFPFCLCMDSDCPQQTRTTNLDPPLRSHFLFQSLVLQSFGSGFQLYPLIFLTPE